MSATISFELDEASRAALTRETVEGLLSAIRHMDSLPWAMTVEEVAKQLSTSAATIRRAIEEDDTFQPVAWGRSTRIPTWQVLALLNDPRLAQFAADEEEIADAAG